MAQESRSDTSTDRVQSANTPARSDGGTGALESTHGRTSISDAVVQKIAGIATREVNGVHNLGTGSARAFGALRERIPGSGGPQITQGVTVEVGEKQTAIDLDIVVEYGVAIAQLAQNVRRNVIQAVERMTGLEVIEVNIAVDDIKIAGDETADETPEPSRVQ
ncbi:MAG: Asp23/Gls24 family envelope stress response protein [Mycobacteriales bacterium]